MFDNNFHNVSMLFMEFLKCEIFMLFGNDMKSFTECHKLFSYFSGERRRK
jgi:hypothetical protein